MSLPGNAQEKREVKQIQQTYMDDTSVSNLATNDHDHEGFNLTSNDGLQQISGEDATDETLVGLPRQSHTAVKEPLPQYKEG